MNNIKQHTIGNPLLFLIFFFLLFSCKTVPLKKHGNVNDAILNSINDFRTKNKNLFKKDSVYHIVADEEYEFYRIIIIGSSTKHLYNPKIELSENKLPSGVYEIDDKLFIWYDSTKVINSAKVELLKKYNVLVDNEGGTTFFLDDVMDDSKRGVTYYICKNKLSNFKKRVSNFVPRSNRFLKCNQE